MGARLRLRNYYEAQTLDGMNLADLNHDALLQERAEALDDAISPRDWHESPLRHARLVCGCEWRCDGHAYGYAVNPRWVRECDLHGETI